ncbi:hypothetical protein BKA70DRAFT_560508 [Coprinopsis sp. MPI-PUGE-AT-0042]|nr:hypothetical protein BKA70DRAFT_560508 [Coprinopsis sp. MPI-PUGE-AT-0042]
MPSSKQVHPCLPEEFIRNLKNDPSALFERSYILEPQLETFRTEALKLGKDRTPMEIPLVMERPDISFFRSIFRNFPPAFQQLENMNHECDSFLQEDNKTFLHLAAGKGDVPLAYEMVRMGTNLEHKDRNGATALFIAALKIAVLTSIMDLVEILPPINCVPLPETLQRAHIQKLIACHTRIATMLIEQHADVNVLAFDVSPLSLAAQSGSWALVELLLRHGADRTHEDDIHFSNTTDKSRYSSLLAMTTAEDARPPRPCPCWSGKLLRDCHDTPGVEHPWPSHFLCSCGRKKVFSECCGKRGLKVLERWDPEDKWIMPSTQHQVVIDAASMVNEYISPEMRPFFQDALSGALDDMMSTVGDGLSGYELGKELEDFTKNRAAIFKQMAALTQREHCFDDAFWYALDKTDFFPRPSQWEKLFSKVECRKMMDEWNAAVDEYMRTDGRFRDRFTVEYEAKIGMDGGPLYKICSAEDCGSIEKYHVPALMKCSGCGLARYCSKDCQRKSWKSHKNDCKAGTVQPQQSTSQWNLEGLALTMTTAFGTVAKGMSFT